MQLYKSSLPNWYWQSSLTLKSIEIDFVVITGDLIDGNIKLAKEMLEPFSLLTCPIYYVTGNHEDHTWKEEAFNLIQNNSNIIHMPNNVINFQNKFF